MSRTRVIVISVDRFDQISGRLSDDPSDFETHQITTLAELHRLLDDDAQVHAIIHDAQHARTAIGEVAAKLQQKRLSTPIIALGREDDDDRAIITSIKQGATDYVRHLEGLPEVVASLAHIPSEGITGSVLNHLLYRSIDHAPLILFSIDSDGRVTFVAGEGLKYLGAEDQQITGKYLDEIFPELELYPFMKRLRATETTHHYTESPGQAWDIYCSSLLNADGEFSGGTGIIINTTANTLMMQELFKSDSRFNKTFNVVPIALMITSLKEGYILEANAAAYVLTGRSADLLIGYTLAEIEGLLPPQHAAEVLETLSKNGRVRYFESRLTTLFGEARRVLISAEYIDVGDEHCALLAFLDLTEYYEAEEALRESELKLRSVFDGSLDVILVIDGEAGTILSANQAAKNVLDYEPQDLTGKHFSTLIGVDETLNQMTLEDIAAYGSVIEVHHLTKRDGTSIAMELLGTIIQWGKRRAVLVILRDIRERLQAYNQVREAEQRLRMVLANAPVTLFSLDENGVFTLSEGQEIGNAPGHLEQCIGQSVFDVYADHPAVLEDIRRAMAGEQVRSIVRLYGRVLETYYSPLHGDDGSVIGLTGVTVDNTKREEAESFRRESDRLRIELEKERELTRDKERFMSLVSHEFRTPLTVIMSSAQLLSNYGDRVTPDRREKHLERIVGQVEYMTELLDQVLAVERAQAGRLMFQPQNVNVLELVEDIISHVGPRSDEHDFTFNHSRDLESVYVDSKLIRHILTNLLSNAVKYTPRGGHITLEVRRREDIVYMVVTDTGMGIPDKELKRIFQPFFRASNSSTVKGTGLGLPLVKYCAEVHGGNVAVESAVDVGTVVNVMLPVYPPPSTNHDTAASED